MSANVVDLLLEHGVLECYAEILDCIACMVRKTWFLSGHSRMYRGQVGDRRRWSQECDSRWLSFTAEESGECICSISCM